MFSRVLIFHTFVNSFFPPTCRQMYERLKCDWTLSSSATSLKIGKYTLLLSIFTLLFIYCSEFVFKESYLPSDSHTNTVNFRPICQSTQNAARGAIFLRIADCGYCLRNKDQWNIYKCSLYLCKIRVHASLNIFYCTFNLLKHRVLKPADFHIFSFKLQASAKGSVE